MYFPTTVIIPLHIFLVVYVIFLTVVVPRVWESPVVCRERLLEVWLRVLLQVDFRVE